MAKIFLHFAAAAELLCQYMDMVIELNKYWLIWGQYFKDFLGKVVNTA